MTWELLESLLQDINSLIEHGKQFVHEVIISLEYFFGKNYFERCLLNEHPLYALEYPFFDDTPGVGTFNNPNGISWFFS